MDEIEILFTPDQIAKAAGFTAEKVRGLCSTGRLKSVNVSTGNRPRYRVKKEWWENYLTTLAPQPKTKAQKRGAPKSKRRFIK
jgi:hypothetical protein